MNEDLRVVWDAGYTREVYFSAAIPSTNGGRLVIAHT